MLYQSTSRDGTAFEHPDEFRTDRGPDSHLAFGIARTTTRMEIKVVFQELFHRPHAGTGAWATTRWRPNPPPSAYRVNP